MSRSSFFILGFITLFGFSALGFAIIYFFGNNAWFEMFQGNYSFLTQVPLGLAYGFATGFLGWKLIRSKWLNQSLNRYANLIQALELNIHEIIFISFCAGFGEEVLFRGAIQPFLGVWITAVVFVAIHGYLNPKDWKVSVYGLFMTLIIAGIGYGFLYLGIWFSIFAHIAIDIILIKKLNDWKVDPLQSELEE